MDFRILGPLEVLDGDRSVPLPGPKQRALLAALLLRPNEVVSEERLLDELWGADQPLSGKAAVRVRVSQLRKALNGDRDLLATRPPGYVLSLEPHQLDALRFERLLADGRRALAEGDAQLAAASLGDALRLWRGPAFADLSYEEFVQGEISRLEELRLNALEERIEADLALGRHDALIGELEALVAAEPFRERLRRQQMLALYRAGRQAEALAAYRDARNAFVGGLGIEPGRELQELESAILRHDPSLDAPATPAEPREPVADAPRERKLVTVLAADLSSSLPTLGIRDPERAAALLERLREEMTCEVDGGGGRVEIATGGSLVAVFGAPVAQEDHIERALHAALAFRRRLEDGFGDALALRVGIATGEAVVDEAQASVGRPIAMANHFAHAAAPGEVLVGPRAVAAARNAFEFGAPREPLRSRPLLRALSMTRPSGTGTPLVSRQRELDVLLDAFRRATETRKAQLVTIAGDAGVGKSRLVQELWSRLPAESPEPLRRSGRCLASGRGTTYRALADVLREELRLLETDPPESVLRRLAGQEILGLTLGLDVAGDLHPLTAREHLHAAWVELLARTAAERPVVLFLEDLHWAQEPLLDLVERIVAEVAQPLLVVATARPELVAERPLWGRHRDASTIWLEPFTDEEAHEFLVSLDRRYADNEICGQVVSRADGNPFFLEELCARACDIGDANLTPDSVHAVLAARIDLLPPVEKAALQAASVIGRIFWRGPLRELLDGDTPDLAVLESRDFIRRRSGSSLAGEREFTFKHALTRDVAYASLTTPRRARLHASFAAWLERLGEERDDYAGFLAHHYYEAARPADADLAWAGQEDELLRLRERASVWLERAARLAVGRYEIDDALVMLERALELEIDPARQGLLWRIVGRANALRHDGDPFLDAMTRAIELAGSDEERADLYAELCFETAMRSGMWRQRPGRDLVDGWISHALELCPPDSAARARALIARCVWDPAGSAAEAREASELAERLGDPELRSSAWDARGITSWVAGEHDLGRAWTERRFELVDRISDPDHLADIHYAPITGCVWLGYLKEARRLARRHDEITRGLTPHHRVHAVALYTEVEELTGGWEEIARLEERAGDTILENRETPCVRGTRSLLVCALARLHLGEAERAAFLERQAEEFGMEGYGHVLETPRLRLALVRGDTEGIERLLAAPQPDRGWHRGWMLLSTHAARIDALAALRQRAELDAWPHVRRKTYLHPFLTRARALVHEDEAGLARAAAEFESLGLDWHAARTRAGGV